ncbi:FHA domain-containing protein [Vitiosangium sp. GDMCC 1.1324]|uniref:FHA domain-containing protein n=1 Tax=Vitiosangium sp. (strain GDMCC 1.1324) TaxID=2138576 RepID=UPI000D3CEEBB|nr:FHA domain-containing protein [Vitiosangium sp. GDMCC 1.1324]PTL81703.1 FHA domain-containing protein [Vitiosangium sp. GDMCC 1.1324]
MARALLLSLLVRQHLALKEKFRARYPHSWLVWEAGVWNVPETSEQNHGTTRLPTSELYDCLPSGDAMCFELAAAPGKDELTLGRASHNVFVVNDATVSREHLVLHAQPDGRWMVSALAQGGPAMLSGKLLRPGQPMPLESGMQLQLGDVRLTFHDAESFHTRMGHTAALMLANQRGSQQNPA